MLTAVDARRLRILDIALVAWCTAWITAGIWVGTEVNALRGLADAGTETGVAVERTGSALELLGSVPLVGDEFGDATGAVTRAGGRVRAESAAAGEGIPETAVLLGLAIALAPTVPLLVVYLPARRTRRRRVHDLRRILDAGGDEAAVLRALLAQQSVLHRPLDDLLAVSDQPLGDLAAGRRDALADAELRRLGIRPRAAR